MEISEHEIDKVKIITLKGEIMGGPDTEKFQARIYQAIEDGKINVVADMAQATWMNSSGLGMLISGLTTLRSSGGDLRLANLSERMHRPLQITKLDTVFQIYESVEKAVESY